MTTIRLTREFSFETAHALIGYDGPCRQIHGHSYKLFVTVAGVPSTDPVDPKLGMVMDFGQLKEIVNRLIISKYDHAFVIRATEDSSELIRSMSSYWDRVVTTEYQPTCENMIISFVDMIRAELPAGIKLVEIKLYETEKSHAAWRLEDNNR